MTAGDEGKPERQHREPYPAGSPSAAVVWFWVFLTLAGTSFLVAGFSFWFLWQYEILIPGGIALGAISVLLALVLLSVRYSRKRKQPRMCGLEREGPDASSKRLSPVQVGCAILVVVVWFFPLFYRLGSIAIVKLWSPKQERTNATPVVQETLPSQQPPIRDPIMATKTPVAVAPATPTAREVAEGVLPSVVMLIVEDANGSALAMGSGFVVRDGLVATSLHVVAPEAAGGYAKAVRDETTHRILGAVAKDANWDLVLLSVPSIKAHPLPLGDERQLAVGDKVYVAGNPQGLEGTFSEGIVSAIRRDGSDTLLQFTAPISQGSSGGPVLDQRGLVVGVAAWMIKSGQNLNFAVPVTRVKSLLSGMRQPVALSALELWEPNLARDEARYVVWLEAALESCEETLLNLIVAMVDIDSYSPAGFLAFLEKRSPAGLCYAMYYGSPNIPTFNECPLRVKQAYSFTYEAVNSVFSAFSSTRQALFSSQNLKALPNLFKQLCVRYEKNRDAAKEELYKLRAGQK